MLLVSIRLGLPETVIDMPHDGREFERRQGARDEIEQYHRVPPSGHGDQQAPPANAMPLELGFEVRIQHDQRIPRRPDAAAPHRSGPTG